MTPMLSLRLTRADIALIDRAIGELTLPYKETPALNDLVARINEQIAAQSPRPSAASPAAAPATHEIDLEAQRISELPPVVN